MRLGVESSSSYRSIESSTIQGHPYSPVWAVSTCQSDLCKPPLSCCLFGQGHCNDEDVGGSILVQSEMSSIQKYYVPHFLRIHPGARSWSSITQGTPDRACCICSDSFLLMTFPFITPWLYIVSLNQGFNISLQF